MANRTKRQRRNKKYKYHINRKRLAKAQKKTGVAAAKVPIVRESWEDKKSIRQNLSNMGLSFDPNVTLKIPTAKESLKPFLTDEENENTTNTTFCPEKLHVAEELEADAKAPREKKFKLPNGQIIFLSYLINKYGDDYKAMEKDKKNIYQETWKQIRNKIRTFQKIPSQWNTFLASQSETARSELTT